MERRPLRVESQRSRRPDRRSFPGDEDGLAIDAQQFPALRMLGELLGGRRQPANGRIVQHQHRDAVPG